MFKAPQWLKKLFFIESQKLIKERSNSTLLNISNKNLNELRCLKQPMYNFDGLNHSENGGLSFYNISNNNSLSKKGSSQCNKQEKDNQLHKLTKLLKQNFRKLDDERTKIKNIEEIAIEWKEIARRLDRLFLVLSFITIVTAPIILFGKFIIRDISPSKNCGCDHSFI